MIGNKLEPFKFWCQKVLPNVYDDSLSYYEYLCKLNEYLNEVIGQINTLTDNMEDYEADLTATWLETKNYIDNYFNNLNVQQEINNKLDQMAQSGALSTLLAPIVGTQIGTVVAEQIGGTVANQIGGTVASQIGPVVASQIDAPTVNATNAWLNAHVNPVGSAVIVDNTLTVSGAAADSKTVGDYFKNIERDMNSPLNADSITLYNAYDDSNALKGYALVLNPTTHVLTISEDSRYGISNKIVVAPGYKSYPVGTVSGVRSNHACRAYYVTDKTGLCITSSTEPSQQIYTNNSTDVHYVQYITYVNHPDVTVTDLIITVKSSSEPTNKETYKPFGTLKYNVDDKITNLYNQAIKENYNYGFLFYNVYNDEFAKKGYTLVYNSETNTAKEVENPLFNISDYIMVPPEYTVFSCGVVNNQRSIASSSRAYFVYDAEKNYSSHNLDMSIMKYDNNTANPMYIRYVCFSDVNPNYHVTDYVIRIIKTTDTDRLKLQRYFDFGVSNERVLFLSDYAPSNYIVIAHQLGMGLGPGNTLPAFKASVKKGFKYVEFDVQKTLDGKFVLSHDDELWILTGGIVDLNKNSSTHSIIYISQTSYNDLLAYDFGADYGSQFAGTKILLLDDLLLNCKKLDIVPVIDIKYVANETDVKNIIAKFRQYGLDRKAIYTTYYSEGVDPTWHTLEYLIDNLNGCKIQGAAFSSIQDTYAKIKAIITSMESHNVGKNNELMMYLDSSLITTYNDNLIQENISIIANAGDENSGIMNYFLTTYPNACGYLINNGYYVGKDLFNYVQNQLW